MINGITLVALIITIIILIILVAISIGVIVNNNLIELATRAAKNYTEAEKYEDKIMENYAELLGAVGENLSVAGSNEPGKPTADGYFTERSTKDGGEGNSMNPTIPRGFRPVDDEGASWGEAGTKPTKENVDKGLVIEDKKGNQFVWVPCSTNGEDGITPYAKHQYTGEGDNLKDETTNKPGEDGWMTYCYRAYNDWKDPAVDTIEGEENSGYGKTSVSQYGGFYVARFEAGIPEDAPFYNEAVKTGYKPQCIDGVFTPPEEKDIRNRGDIAPISKKNTPSWSWMNQTNAKSAAEKMVQGNSGVKSYLIDGTAWDTIVEWINDEADTVTDSKGVGNYYTSEGTITGWYITHTYAGGKYTTGKNYQKAGEEGVKQLGGQSTNRIEIYTGSMENTKLKNIYDMAGNMWEWTTEKGTHGGGSETYAVIRSGSFRNDGVTCPLCKRNGNYDLADSLITFGFRVVLYLT